MLHERAVKLTAKKEYNRLHRRSDNEANHAP